jgi:hypothetical protein
MKRPGVRGLTFCGESLENRPGDRLAVWEPDSVEGIERGLEFGGDRGGEGFHTCRLVSRQYSTVQYVQYMLAMHVFPAATASSAQFSPNLLSHGIAYSKQPFPEGLCARIARHGAAAVRVRVPQLLHSTLQGILAPTSLYAP